VCDEYSVIIATYPNKESAKCVAQLLIEKRLAACAQLFPIESVYLWQGKVCDEREVMMFIKSKTTLFDEIAAFIKENHSYKVPEIVRIPITDGLPEYLGWIKDCTENSMK
jgi:periplasmic divalent cation tolerance protein